MEAGYVLSSLLPKSEDNTYKYNLEQRTFTIPGEPGAKGRPRLSVDRYRGYPKIHTPDKTINYENLVILEYDKVYHEAELYAPKVMLELSIDAYYTIPESISKKKKEAMAAGLIRPTKKPDIDNVLKIIADALNKVAYHDDSQIVSVCVNKYYSEKPRVEVALSKINTD